MRILSYFSTFIVSICLVLTGCASSLSGDTYSRDEARRGQTVQTGVITHIRTVNIEGTNSGVGTATGAIAGAVVGSAIDHRSSGWSVLGGLAGAVAGGWAGSRIEDRVTRSQGLEITVRLDSGVSRAVVQQPSAGESFNVGDHVRILTNSQGTSRVTR